MADGKFLRDFLENPTHETCSKLHGAVWDLWPFLQGKNAADLRGEAQEFRAGGEPRHSHLHDRVVSAANHVFLDLSFGVCCHSSLKNKTVSGHFGSWDSL